MIALLMSLQPGSRLAVDQCWPMKEPLIREEERAEAEAAYDHARRVYD